MPRIKHFTFLLAVTFFTLAANVRAQTPSIEVTTDSHQARFTAQGQAQAIHVQVFSPSGELVFVSDSLNHGQAVEWQMLNEKGERVPDGVYSVTITLTDFSGKRRKLIEQIAVSSGTPEKLTAAAEPPTANAVAPINGEGATGRLAKFTGTNSIGNSVITESNNKVGVNITPTATFQANGIQPAPSATIGRAASVLLQTSGGKGGNTTGTTGQTAGAGAGISLVAGSGGDAPAGSKRGNGGNITLQPGSTGAGAGTAGSPGNVLIAPGGVGNVGIGTASPASRLTVNGGIQILGSGNGIKFPDGSIQTEAATGSGPGPTGTGTAGSIVKFTGANSIGDSVIKESGGNVGIGTTTPARPLEIATGGLRFSSNYGDVEFTEVADLTAWATTTNPNPNLPALRVHTGASFPLLFTLMNNGNVGIGTAIPQAKLDVAGTIRVSPTIRVKSIHAAAFMPSDPDCSHANYLPEGIRTSDYSTTGCIYKYIAPLELPDGAVITEFAIDAIDNDYWSNINGALGRTNLPNDGVFNIAEVSTSGKGTYVQRPFVALSQQVFNDNNVYWISLTRTSSNLPPVESSYTLIGVRIKYQVTQPLP